MQNALCYMKVLWKCDVLFRFALSFFIWQPVKEKKRNRKLRIFYMFLSHAFNSMLCVACVAFSATVTEKLQSRSVTPWIEMVEEK